jgi:hypothetical protein
MTNTGSVKDDKPKLISRLDGGPTISYNSIDEGDYSIHNRMPEVHLSETHDDEPRHIGTILSADDDRFRGTYRSGQKLRSKSFMTRSSEYTSSTALLKKPETIKELEKVLSDAYQGEVQITKISKVGSSTKSVKEVMFLSGNQLMKVWIFKADPQKTINEMKLYQVAYDNGIPTGKPIMNKESYLFSDFALLGGIVNHCGEPYDTLMENLELKPQEIFNTAKRIVSIITSYQNTLTPLIPAMLTDKILLKVADPSTELENRFIRGSGLNERSCEKLVRLCQDLYGKLSTDRVFSHEDTHTGNIATIRLFNAEMQQYASFVDKFGIIDWGSAGIDHPLSDIMNFWIHHERKAHQITNGQYPYSSKDILRYMEKYHGTDVAGQDAMILSALWHMYEIYDPVRKDAKDIEWKKQYHASRAKDVLKELSKSYSIASKISVELQRLVN